MKYGLEKITHALTSHLIWQSFPTTLVLLGLGGGVLFTSAWLNLHTRDPNSCWPPSATTTGIGRQSTGAGRGSCFKTLVTLRCLAIGPGVSCQRMWAVHTYKRSSSSHNNSICVIHQIGSNAPLGERRTAFFFFLSSFAVRILWKHRTLQLENLPLQGSAFLGLHPAALR